MSSDPSATKKRTYPWLEISLVLVLVFMIFSSLNAFYGQNIRNRAEQICTELDLWCAPPTPTPTFTPTPTSTPPATPTPAQVSETPAPP